ncbi:MAG: hypothetical protein Q8L60_08105 [Gammaproteobacteria bacterium]|nr:hypothetical protein [Gammaproteobacteria bacterium]
MSKKCAPLMAKRWIFGIALAVLLFMVGIVSLAWWRPGYVFLATATLFPEFAAKWMVNWREKMANSMTEQSAKNLESEVIRTEIEGRSYNVPIRYTYGQAIEKNGRWPTAKLERVKVGALTISVLLPDMKPYYPEDDARWRVKGHGDRVEVTITNSLGKPDWFQRYRGKYFNGQDKYSTRQDEVYGLILFAGHGYTSDTYFPANDEIELTMSCDKQPKSTGFSPSCSVKTNYLPGIALRYYYSKDYLPRWQEIDVRLKALFDQFERSAHMVSNNGGK